MKRIAYFFRPVAAGLFAEPELADIQHEIIFDGANIHLARDIDECETPLDLVEYAKLSKIVKYLKAHGAVHGKSASDKTAP